MKNGTRIYRRKLRSLRRNTIGVKLQKKLVEVDEKVEKELDLLEDFYTYNPGEPGCENCEDVELGDTCPCEIEAVGYILSPTECVTKLRYWFQMVLSEGESEFADYALESMMNSVRRQSKHQLRNIVVYIECLAKTKSLYYDSFSTLTQSRIKLTFMQFHLILMAEGCEWDTEEELCMFLVENHCFTIFRLIYDEFGGFTEEEWRQVIANDESLKSLVGETKINALKYHDEFEQLMLLK